MFLIITFELIKNNLNDGNEIYRYSYKTGIKSLTKPHNSSGGYKAVKITYIMNNIYFHGDLRFHRLIYFLNKGYFPDQIDHSNLNRGDNKLSNIKESFNGLNHKNKSNHTNSKSNFIGVCKLKDKWIAQIRIKSKIKRICLESCELTAAIKYNSYILNNRLENYYRNVDYNEYLLNNFKF